MSKSFFDFFPPPKILAVPTAGLSISDHTVRVVEYVKKGGKLGLKTWGEYPLPAGAVVRGSIADQAKLVEVLEKVRKEKNILAAGVALPEEKSFVYVGNVTVPEGGTLRDAVALTIAENIPLSPPETVFDFNIIGTTKVTDDKTGETKHATTVVVSAFPLDVASQYAEALSAAHITPIFFETESQAIARAVVPHGREGAFVIVHFTSAKATIAVVMNDAVPFATVVFGDNGPVDPSVVKDELVKVVSYWHSDRGGKRTSPVELKEKIQSIIVSGDVSGRKDIADYFSKNLRLQARLANVWQNAFSAEDAVPDIHFERSLVFATASGLALYPFLQK